MADTAHRRKHLVQMIAAVGVALIIVTTAVIVTAEIQDRNDRKLEQQITRTTADLELIGTQISSMRDALTGNMNEYISTYREMEPLLSHYGDELDSLRSLYKQAQERERHRKLIDLVRGYSMYNPARWEDMREIIELTGQINDIMKRQASVIHDMALLPESERVQFWHERFLPLQRREQALRERLSIVGQRMPSSPREQ